jgi:hypothetical protein
MDFTQQNQKYQTHQPPELLKRINKILCQKQVKERKKQLNNCCTMIIINSEEDLIYNNNYQIDYLISEEQKSVEKNKIEQRKKWAEEKQKYRLKNKEKILAYQREYYHKNREQQLKKILKNRKKRKNGK